MIKRKTSNHDNGREIKVLHVYKTYFPDTAGGLERAIFQICRSTMELGVKNAIFTLTRLGSGAVIQRPEAEIHRFPITMEIASCPFSMRALGAFRKHALKADIIHYHFPWPFADLLDFLRPAGKPSVITYHSDIVRQRRLLFLYRPLMRRFLSRARKIVATSPNYLGTSEVLQDFKRNVEVIPFGLDRSSYPGADSVNTAHWRSVYGDGFFLFIGVLRYYKGLHILLRAAKHVPYKILIVGAGPIEEDLKQTAHRLGLDSVFFLGSISDEDKIALLSLCRAVVFPSHLRSEAFGMALLEAAMLSRPMISSEIGTGTSYVNVDGETGIVVPPNEPLALREAMDRLHADPRLAAKLGEKARSRFEALFTADKMGARYRQVYEQLLAEKANG